MLIIDGREVAQIQKNIVKTRVQTFLKTNKHPPGLAVILVGNDPASTVYVANKEKACKEVGFNSYFLHLEEKTTPEVLLKTIRTLNEDSKVHGILVQMPVPKHIKYEQILATISPLKDVDGLTSENMGYAWAGKARVQSCTPQGIMVLLKHYNIKVAGKNAVVIGRSNIVGKPAAQFLLDADATVTICHSKTENLTDITKQADILVVAAGKPNFLGKEAVKKGAVVIDVGIHRKTDGKLCGDVRLEELENWASAVTPVPGGVGPMTIAMLLKNTIDLAELNGRR